MIRNKEKQNGRITYTVDKVIRNRGRTGTKKGIGKVAPPSGTLQRINEIVVLSLLKKRLVKSENDTIGRERY